MQKILPKGKLNDFLKSLMKDYELYAPVKKDNTKFQLIKNPDEIYLDKITDVPAKKLFIPENEILLEYKQDVIKEKLGKINKRIIFGLRLCDLNAIDVLEKIMPDLLFINKRKNTILIGISCRNPDNYCFCNSMELDDKCYDLFFYLDNSNYIIDVKTDLGRELVKNLPNIKKDMIIPKPVNKKVLLNKDIEKNYQDSIWDSDAEKCLSCSACTIYCPTCNCFDIKDELNINLKDSIRKRHEMSCQLKSFSQVAGGKIFRESRLARFKHFVYHKIVYYKNKKDRYMCVGCGRCLRVCPPKIDWVETINLLKEEENIKNKIKRFDKK